MSAGPPGEGPSERIASGAACCVLCGEAIAPGEDALLTPDFLADDTDPLWRYTDAPMHRACFLVWDGRKAFIARFNTVARRLVDREGFHPHMTSEGTIVRRAVSGSGH